MLAAPGRERCCTRVLYASLADLSQLKRSEGTELGDGGARAMAAVSVHTGLHRGSGTWLALEALGPGQALWLSASGQ
jgi:hypothetical protein